MSNKDFNWDRFSSLEKFSEIQKLSPDLGNRRLPTMYSPDKRFLYLSSQDIGIETDNQDELRSVLSAIKSTYDSALRAKPVNHFKAYVSQIDFREVCQLLAQCTGELEEFADPDHLLLSRS